MGIFALTTDAAVLIMEFGTFKSIVGMGSFYDFSLVTILKKVQSCISTENDSELEVNSGFSDQTTGPLRPTRQPEGYKIFALLLQETMSSPLSVHSSPRHLTSIQ